MPSPPCPFRMPIDIRRLILSSFQIIILPYVISLPDTRKTIDVAVLDSILNVPPGGINWLTIADPRLSLFLTTMVKGTTAGNVVPVASKIYAL
jgi:hypothetical protein